MRSPHTNTSDPECPWNKAVDVRFGELKAGMKLIADDGFECIPPWSVVEVKEDDGYFYVPCAGPDGECEAGSEQHMLDGQRDHHYGTDIVVGFRRVV